MALRVMVMAGGTGGHVFPALAVADELATRGMEVCWLGVPNSFESRVVPEHGYPIEWINIEGLRGNGVLRWLVAPLKLLYAMYQAFGALRRRRPALVLGMGGFVTGPGGVVARLLGIPLVIHEQNAFPGLTNRLLARIAGRVLEAFPGSFDRRQTEVTGNPVRADIAAIDEPVARLGDRTGRLRLLILGGSQGAQVLNETVPAALALIDGEQRPQVRHQAGRDKDELTRKSYDQLGVKAEVSAFVTDMKEAYSWADLVVCRAGALTVAELAAAGVGAILVPYPHAVDDHQTRNGGYLADEGAALLLPQKRMTPELLAEMLTRLCEERGEVMKMAVTARSLALPKATQRVADICQEVAGR
ncbi:MAG: undecaprenyldiphospho-muramoylpentapeptide beta-N-acetylglucosaminyltransferase [Candidatus Sedimenticola sp. (ex Thyasira tokunagai)]